MSNNKKYTKNVWQDEMFVWWEVVDGNERVVDSGHASNPWVFYGSMERRFKRAHKAADKAILVAQKYETENV